MNDQISGRVSKVVATYLGVPVETIDAAAPLAANFLFLPNGSS